jgi:hypothetical protein
VKGTANDDRWALRNLHKEGVTEASSYRYADPEGVVHRAVWRGHPSPQLRWEACCGAKIVEKLQENDAGAVTCVRCIWGGA